MIRILGSVLDISFQTELLIMTLLGLANSTLDWKPFEVVSQLSLIDDLNFPARSDGEISGNFISWIKKLLTLTVVVQFFCSLLNPLAYLLKLYPIITWSRADVLLPWLTIHALNTILPKMMSLVLAFIFYFESMISTVSLLEFLLVETINLVIAWCNWYLFFDFYMDLRAIERERRLSLRQKVRRSLQESRKSSYTLSSSIPNLKQVTHESSGVLSELRPVRSLGGLTENGSQSVYQNRLSISTSSSDEALTPAEKTIKILSLTDDELQSARIRKGSLNRVLSNADTMDVEVIDLVSPDRVSYASIANTNDSVIIVYDSKDEKKLERILSPVEEGDSPDSHGRDATSEIADEDLLKELLDMDYLPDEVTSMVLSEDEQSLNELKKTDSYGCSLFEEERSSDTKKRNLPGEERLSEIRFEEQTSSEMNKTHFLEEERLSNISKSNLFEEEPSSEMRKSHLLEEERLSKIRKSNLLKEERLLEIKKSNVFEEEPSSEMRKSHLLEEEGSSKIRKSNLLKEERLPEIKKSNLFEEQAPSEKRKSHLLEEERSSKTRKSNLLREERLSEVKKSNLLEKERSLKDRKRYSPREEELIEIKPRQEKLFKSQRPSLPRKEDESVHECVCSSSEDDDDEENNTPTVNARPENFLKPPPEKVDTIVRDNFKPKEQYYAERKKTKNKSAQTVDYPDIPLNTLLSPSTALVPKGSNHYVKSEEKDLHCLLNENFELMDKMCRAMNFNNNQSIPNNSLRKWLVFHHQLESSLDQNAFLKKNGSVIDPSKPRPIGYFSLKDKNTQTEPTLKAKKRHREKRGTLLHYPKMEVVESKWNYVDNFPGTSSDMIGKSLPSNQMDKSVEPSKVIDVSDDKVSHFINIVNFSKTTSASPMERKLTKLLDQPAAHDNREKTSISILKTKVPVKCSELDHSDGQKNKDLRNLQAYNKLTLEQDKRELMQKKKKSKMTSYKNAVTELTLQNSDVVPNRPVKVDKRTCKSNHSRVQNTGETKNQNFKQLFRYNEKLFDQSVESPETSKNPGYQNLEIESCIDKTNLSTGTIVLSACRSDTEIPPQGHLGKAAEDLEQIDWLNPSTPLKSPRRVTLPPEAEEPRHNVIVDDETVSMLKCAFSFSDECERGFRLGPEMREPYPIFQVVALTMAEIFKATGWRNFEESLPDAPVADVIFCEAELDCDIGDEVVDVLDELIRADVEVLDELIRAEEEELERRKCLSVSLIEQLHELLKSSKETLLEVENNQLPDELEDRFGPLENLRVKDGKLVGDIEPAETCVYTVNEQIVSNPLKETRVSIKNSKNQRSELSDRNEALASDGRRSRGPSATRNTRDTARSRIHETKFENRVQKHHCRKGEGLSSGNVMEFDSEGKALNSMNCPSDEAIAEPSDELVDEFNSFCDKFMEIEAGDDENLKALAKSDKFQKFVSLCEEAKEKVDGEEDEVELSNSDFASGETVLEVFVEKQPKENTDKLKDEECDIKSALPAKNLDLPSADVGIPYCQKVKKHREYLETDAIKQRILNWRNESVDSMNSLHYPKKRKLEETRSFSDNSDIEEFSVN